MDGRARVFSFFLSLADVFFCFDRSEMVREKLLLVLLVVTCCTCYLSLVPVIAQRIDAENENEKNKKKEKLKCDNSFFSFFFGQDLTRDLFLMSIHPSIHPFLRSFVRCKQKIPHFEVLTT